MMRFLLSCLMSAPSFLRSIPISDSLVLDLHGSAYVQDWNTNKSNWPNWVFRKTGAYVPAGIVYDENDCAFTIVPGKVISASFAAGPSQMPDVSFAAWIKVPSSYATGSGWLISLAPFHQASRAIRLESGKIVFPGITNVSTGVPLPTDRWVHIAGVWTQNGTNHAYLDGVEIGKSSTVMSMTSPAPKTFVIGGRQDGNEWLSMNIQVSEVALFSRWLFSQEVQRIHAAGRTCQGNCQNSKAPNLASYVGHPLYFLNQHSWKCIDVVGMSVAQPGSWLQIWDCFFNKPTYGQEFTLTSAGQIKHDLSGLCLDIAGNLGVGTRSAVQLHHCDSEARQLESDQFWDVSPEGFLRNRMSCKCIDVEGAPGVINGYVLKLHDCDSVTNTHSDQRWHMLTIWRPSRRLANSSLTPSPNSLVSEPADSSSNSTASLNRFLQAAEGMASGNVAATLNSTKGLNNSAPDPVMITLSFSFEYNSSSVDDMSYEETLAFQQLIQRALQKITGGDSGWTSTLPVLKKSSSSSHVTAYVKLLIPGNETHAPQQAAEVLDGGNVTVIAAALRSAAKELTGTDLKENLTSGLVLEEIRPIAVAGPTNFTPQRVVTVNIRITMTSEEPESKPDAETPVVVLFVTASCGLVTGCAILVISLLARYCGAWKQNSRLCAKGALCFAPIAIILPFVGLLQAYLQIEPESMSVYAAQAWPIGIVAAICGMLAAVIACSLLAKKELQQAHNAKALGSTQVRCVVVGSPVEATWDPVKKASRGVRRLSRRASEIFEMVLPGAQPYDVLGDGSDPKSGETEKTKNSGKTKPAKGEKAKATVVRAR